MPVHAPHSITAKTARGAGWLLGWRLVTRGLGFLSTLVLVRLLLPADFGVVALATSLAAAVDAFSQMVGFSAWSWGITLAAIVRDRCDSAAVGRMLGTSAVGVYAIGVEVAALPVTELIEPLARVLFSGFAAARNAGSSGDAGYARVLGLVCLLVLPMTVGISLLADPLTRLMFGAGWEGAIPLVRILAVGGTLRIFGLIGGTLLTASGMPRTTFAAMLAATCLRLPLVLALTARGGLVGCAWAVLAGTAIEEAIFAVVTLRRFRLSARALLAQVWRPLAAAAVMAGVLRGCGLGWTAIAGSGAALLAPLLGGAALGALVFPATVLALWAASGRPRGAETELLGLLAGALRRVPRPARIEA